MMQTGSYRDYGSMGINRYMLGCKLIYDLMNTVTGELELIDTCWDVNNGMYLSCLTQSKN